MCNCVNLGIVVDLGIAMATAILVGVGILVLSHRIIELFTKYYKADTPRHSQSKKASLLEVTTNTLIGLIIAYHAQVYIFPLYGIQVSTATNVQLVLIFTLISILRSYVLRRIFNRYKYTHRSCLIIVGILTIFTLISLY